MSLQNKYTKIQRIELLKDFSINIVDYQLFKTGCDPKTILKFVESCGRVSIRTQSPTGSADLGYPKLINVQAASALENILEWNKSYDILIAEAINPGLCTKCSNIALLQERILIETVFGPGTLDRLTREGKVDHRCEFSYRGYRTEVEDSDLKKVLDDLIALPIRNIIAEVSFYSTVVGILNKKYIVWEILDW